MTTRDALLAAIAAKPDDDLPRLVFADFLDETGDPTDAARAKLIRTQIEAANLPVGDPHRDELDRRVEELWEAHKSKWFEGVHEDRLPYPERGFITSWGCYSAEHITCEVPVPFEHEPIVELTLSVKSAEELAGAERWPGLARIQELKVWPGATADAGLVPFFSSPHLIGLRSLHIMGNWRRPWSPMPETARLLATLPQYASLQELTIEHAGVGHAGALALVGSTTLRGVTSLGLGQCDIGLPGLRALVASPFVSRVKSLGLGSDAQTAADGEALAEALAGSGHLGQLEGLGLDETAFTDRAAALLARAAWPALKRLSILPHRQTHSDQVTGLPTLTARGVEALVAASWAPSLEDLDLSSHAFGDAGAEALARGNRLASLKRLTLMRTGLTAVGLQALTAAYSRRLELLQLAYNPFGDAGAAVIAEAPWPAMVPHRDGVQRGLLLALCDVTPRGAESLLRSTTIPADIPDLFLGALPLSRTLLKQLKKKYPRATIQF
jgi:uncharacterized protein (TIGR02996 family)